MQKLTRSAWGRTVAVATFVALGTAVVWMGLLSTGPAVADPPENQSYIGSKKCASCHFEQYMTWNKTAHAGAFKDLTAKYQKNPDCLKCHTTGYDKPTGYKANPTASLVNVGCENCHGPGSEHENIATKYAKVKQLSPEQEKEVKGSIWLILPKNVCIECHVMQAHKPSPTPKEMQKTSMRSFHP